MKRGVGDGIIVVRVRSADLRFAVPVPLVYPLPVLRIVCGMECGGLVLIVVGLGSGALFADYVFA